MKIVCAIPDLMVVNALTAVLDFLEVKSSGERMTPHADYVDYDGQQAEFMIARGAPSMNDMLGPHNTGFSFSVVNPTAVAEYVKHLLQRDHQMETIVHLHPLEDEAPPELCMVTSRDLGGYFFIIGPLRQEDEPEVIGPVSDMPQLPVGDVT